MRKIYWLIIKSYLGPLVFTFFIALFILLMQFLWKYIDELVGKGLEWYIIAELLFYASSTFVPLALPLAILLSSLMTFGNLGENYELVAMKASGISLRRIMLPLIVLSILISGVAFYFSNNILPVANLKFKSLLYDVRQQKLALDIKEGVFYNGIDGFIIRIGKKNVTSGRNLQRPISGRARAGIRIQKDRPHASFTPGDIRDYFSAAVSGTVIHAQDLKMFIAIIKY